MRALVLAVALLAAAPATASAALGQVEPITVDRDEECLGATATPGLISAHGPRGVRFIQATREGLKPLAAVRLTDEWSQCEAIATSVSGAGVIVVRNSLDEYFASVRDPGGAWSAAVPVGTSLSELSAAVSDRGDVLLAWRETDVVDERTEVHRLRALRRAPGGAFGVPEPIGADGRHHERIVSGLAATGEAFVMTTSVGSGKPTASVAVSVAAPGAPFGAPAQVAVTSSGTEPTLSVAPDGRALVAAPDGTSMLVAERAPGGGFGPAVAVGAAKDPLYLATAVGLGPAGEASVAWASLVSGRVQFVSRPAAGAPWASTQLDGGTLVPRRYDPFFFTDAFLKALYGADGLLVSAALRPLALTRDGRAAMAWVGVAPETPALLLAPLAGGPGVVQTAGSGFGAAGLSFALTLADGTPALAWTESGGATDEPTRLHLAADGVTERRDPAPPRVTIGAPRSRRLGPKEPLRFPVSCSGPCQVRLRLEAGVDFEEELSLERAGRRVVSFPEAAVLVGRRVRPVRMTVSYRTPGAKHVRTRTTSVRFARRGETPYADVQDVRAVRRGDAVRVTWRLKGTVHEADEPLFVSATKTRARGDEPLALRMVEVGKRRTFAVTLRAGADAKFVTVRTVGFLVGAGRTVVRVRGE